MDGLEASACGWAPAVPLLHAFSLLEQADERAQASYGESVGWRQPVAELWWQIATGDLFGCRRQSLVASRAKRLFAVTHGDLIGLWRGSGASRRAVLRSAAVTLECSARVWQAFGPAAGDRRLHLLRRLEETLARAERDICAGELSLLVNRPTVTRATSAAADALEGLVGTSVDRAEGLARLEDAAVELAALTIRIAMNLHLIGGASRPQPKRSVVVARQLQALAGEVGAAAGRRQQEHARDAEEGHLGVWLSSALKVAPSHEAIQIASARTGDPALRADALRTLRSRWLELAIRLWLIVRAHDELLEPMTFAEEDRLQAAVAARAVSALMACALCGRPGKFDHEHAWACHRAALCELVSDACLALQTCHPDTVVHSQQLALRRLARAVVAIWTIDERVRSPIGEVSEQCR